MSDLSDGERMEDFSDESFSEDLLKTTAITFSLEGVSRDLEVYIQKKVTFNNRNIKHISDIIRSISSCPEAIQNEMLKESSPLMSMLNESLEEVKRINSILTFVIQKVITKEIDLNGDLDEASGSDGIGDSDSISPNSDEKDNADS
jgi:hypothetical protein